MKRKLAGGTFAVIAALVISGASLDGSGSATEAGASQTFKGKRGKLVAKDSAKANPAAAVAQVDLKRFGKVSYAITTKPKRQPVQWGITVRCEKGFTIDYFPGPGEFKTTTKKTTIKGVYRTIPVKDPDVCRFAVAGQIAPGKRGKVFTKIYNRP